MGDAHFYDPQLDPNLQGECAICGGRPDDPAHRWARIDALRVAASREAELRTQVKRLTNEAVLKKAECDGLGSLLLSVQKDCIEERKRANKAEAEAAELRALLDDVRASGQKKHRRAQELEASVSKAEWQLEMFDCYRDETWLSAARTTLAKIGAKP
jgi:hypothetical protein